MDGREKSLHALECSLPNNSASPSTMDGRLQVERSKARDGPAFSQGGLDKVRHPSSLLQSIDSCFSWSVRAGWHEKAQCGLKAFEASRSLFLVFSPSVSLCLSPGQVRLHLAMRRVGRRFPHLSDRSLKTFQLFKCSPPGLVTFGPAPLRTRYIVYG
jgi:hypothetical protein